MPLRPIVASAVVALFLCSSAFAQSFGVGVHVAGSQWSEFDGTDTGVGASLTFKPIPLIGLDAELTWYPSDFTKEGSAFTQSRVEGLFGATVGPKLGSVRPLGKAAAGFLRVAQLGPLVCIAIFPPPLRCALAGGDTLPALQVGGGVEVDTGSRTFLRADAGWRFLKYPGPTFGSNFEIHDEGFFGGALRFTVGAGVKF